jgi:L-2,4-diaminobutyrate decarboxylase
VVVGTTFHHGTWLKLTLLNPTATIEDLRAVLSLVHGIGHDLLDSATEEVAR